MKRFKTDSGIVKQRKGEITKQCYLVDTAGEDVSKASLYICWRVCAAWPFAVL